MEEVPFEALRPHDILNGQITAAHKAAYNLLQFLGNLYRKSGETFQVATSESLTGGLIFSTLVDIPFGGAHKYGGFAVYDTDAKRVFNGVTVDDVYTHKCATEMAVGVLNNSHASIAIAVTGNAMPYQNNEEDMKKLGEVFIGLACYVNENNTLRMKVRTIAINACYTSHTRMCSLWYEGPGQEKKNKRTSERTK